MRNPEPDLPDGELSAMLRSIDHPVPRVSADHLMARVRRHRARKSALLAASALVCAATIATAAVPGTALHELVRGLLAGSTRAVVGGEQPSPVVPVSPPREAPMGVAFVPGDRAIIVFRRAQSAGELRIRVEDVASVQLTQASAEGDVRYDLTPDGVDVDNEGSSASYELVIPRALARAAVRVGGAVVATKERMVLSCGGKRAAGASCVVPLRLQDGRLLLKSAVPR